MTKRRKNWRKNRRLTCWCNGWWFPHRRGSKASEELQKRMGAAGCYQEK